MNVNTAEDYALWMKIAHSSSKLRFVPLFLGNYRVHDSNNIHKSNIHCKAIIRAKQDALTYSGIQLTNIFEAFYFVYKPYLGAIKMSLLRVGLSMHCFLF